MSSPRREGRRYEFPSGWEDIQTSGISDAIAEKCLDFLRDTAEPFAAWKARRIFLERKLKTVHAIEAEGSGHSSQGAKDRAGYAAPAYIEATTELEEAQFNETLLGSLRDAAEAKFEAWRTKNANERAGIS